ncbi:14026_t:CDS:2 [Funneliformis geosporum]|uniref:14026_t:CDS:1 n=1 Tax=Funneliformis geosporum TaxID=1117311 RepID=A0A9W4SAN3_9GLOM|nr:14026_t:CDS:2 [Funneliformis geosporum]
MTKQVEQESFEMVTESSNFLKDLSNDFANLLTNGNDYDVIIQAGDGPNSKEFRAHSIILGARSTYFRTALSKDWAHKKDAADEIDLPKLYNYIQSFIVDVDFMQEDPVEILEIVIQHEACSTLKDSCLEKICNHPKKLFDSSKFLSLDKSIIILLLKRDDLSIEEIEIWKYLLKWGIAQMETKLDIEKLAQWTEENFVEFEKILHDFIPLIRWFQIPAKIFWRNVRQFEKVFPKNLYQDILGYIIDPDTPPNSTETGDSFLFSFASKNSRNGNIARVTNKIHAVSYVTKYGPCFGGGWDLAIEKDLIISYKASSYSGNNFLSSNNYHLEDYEVFQVIKK